jgi:hypothetical protein
MILECGVGLSNLLSGFDSVQNGHPNIEKNNVRAEFCRFVDGF